MPGRREATHTNFHSHTFKNQNALRTFYSAWCHTCLGTVTGPRQYSGGIFPRERSASHGQPAPTQQRPWRYLEAAPNAVTRATGFMLSKLPDADAER